MLRADHGPPHCDKRAEQRPRCHAFARQVLAFITTGGGDVRADLEPTCHTTPLETPIQPEEQDLTSLPISSMLRGARATASCRRRGKSQKSERKSGASSVWSGSFGARALRPTHHALGSQQPGANQPSARRSPPARCGNTRSHGSACLLLTAGFSKCTRRSRRGPERLSGEPNARCEPPPRAVWPACPLFTCPRGL